MIPPLVAENFSADKVAKVVQFDCTDDNKHPWEMYLNEWIKGQEALDAMKNFGTSIWLYFSDESLVGYGSLGKTRICWPYPTGDRQSLSIIPAIAVSREFRGKPAGAKREERFAWRILADIVSRAIPLNRDLLALYVHEKNAIAKRFYENFGFQMIGPSHIDSHYLMVLNLRALASGQL